MWGLDENTLFRIRQVFAQFEQIEKVILYGSRAKGNYRNGSDIDLVLEGKNLDLGNTLYPLMQKLDDLDLPYTFDIAIVEQIENQALIDHIRRIGTVFYNLQNP